LAVRGFRLQSNQPESITDFLQGAFSMAKNMAAFPASNDDDDDTRDESREDSKGAKDTGGVAGQRLRSFLERIERLEEEKKGLADDVKDVYAEANGVGFDVKTMRQIIKLRKLEPEKRREEDELLELYKAAIGMQ
jgi:uncharacterized protein (UPF0335 family)